jgi:hypothetical protein
MTRSHRRNHLVAWLVLTPAILGVLIAGLVARAKAEAQRTQPPGVAQGANP